ncbi:hypothetical protein D5086_014707 [Populus alba]|uniref:Uncharacterized protein n=1 Tax=Populus alba TaxID=43335 RepID=A0ACC4BYZ1_POPAL
MCKPWPGVVILTEETAAEQQPYRALSANSATKAADSRYQVDNVQSYTYACHSELLKMNSGERALRYNKESCCVCS